MKKKKFNFTGAIAIAIAALVLAVFVPFNIVAGYNDKVYDMTPSKQYTLNSKTKDLLDETSDKDIQVYFLMEGLNVVKDAPEYLALYHTLSELKKRDNITLTCFDPDEDPDLAAELDPNGTTGVERGDVFVRCGKITKRVSHDKIYQSTISGGNTIREYAGENLIAGAIKTCTAGSLQTMYFLTGHGEKTIEDSYATFARSIQSDNYSTDSLDLDETGAIPGNTAAIWLVGPQKDITDKERDLLLSFLSDGGSVSMLLGPSETEGRFRNIETVLKTFGIEMDYNIITEESAANQLRTQSGELDPAYFTVEYPYKTDDFTQDLTTDINYLIAVNERSAGTVNTRSLGMLPDSQYEAANYEVCSIMRNVADIDGKYTTKSTALGGDDTTSDFANNDLNEIQVDLGFYSYNMVTGGKLFVLGSCDIIDPSCLPKTDANTPPIASSTLALFANTWLYDSDIDMGIGNKVNAYDTMTFKDADEARHVMAMTAILPVALILFGIIVWLKRRHA